MPWVNFTVGGTQLRIDYFLGVDGLSLPMVILNALLTVLAVIGGWEKVRVKRIPGLDADPGGWCHGRISVLDLLLFFLFWEVDLAPMFLLIGIWGNQAIKHGMPGRIYSAWKFLLYTFFGSVFMLAGILLLYFTNVSNHGVATASMPYFATHFLNGYVNIFGVTMGLQLLTFLLIFLAFAVQNTDVSIPYVVAGCPYGCSTEVSVIWRWYTAENGCLWADSYLLHAASFWGECFRAVAGCTRGDQYHLWCGNLSCADGYEEAHRLFQCESHGYYPAGGRGGGAFD